MQLVTSCKSELEGLLIKSSVWFHAIISFWTAAASVRLLQFLVFVSGGDWFCCWYDYLCSNCKGPANVVKRISNEEMEYRDK